MHLVEARAEQRASDDLYTFLPGGEPAQSETLAYGQLQREAERIARLLAAHGVAGEPVLLLFLPGLDFVRAFFGCLRAAAVAVPVYPPDPRRMERSLERLRAIAVGCRARVVLTSRDLAPLVRALLVQDPLLADRIVLSSDDDGEGKLQEAYPGPDDVALLQYTSGSTGTPRGVVLTHSQLLANSGQIQRAFGTGPDMRVVTWLPPYHDMGLIGSLLHPLFVGGTALLFPTLHFLQQPVRWLRALTWFRGTTSGGPNFAFDLTRRKVTEVEKDSLDLRSWSKAFNGAEPVRADTLDRFAEAFARCGFRREAFYPCYGLAEAALMVAGPQKQKGSGALARVLDAAALRRGEIRAGIPGDPVSVVVSCGSPVEGTVVATVDPVTQRRLGPGQVGELWVRGPSVAQGYFGEPEQSLAVFGAQIAGEDGTWMRTGDLGALVDGELLVTGRLKDVLVVRGRNLYPQDVERSVERAHPRVRPGCTTAVSAESKDGEGVAVLAEIGGDLASGLTEIVLAIARAVLDDHEVAPQAVVLVPPGALPKTSSGKLQRRAAREMWRKGELPVIALDPPPAVPQAVPQTSAVVYDHLPERFARLDRRTPRYQFDLESLPWHLLGERGLYYPVEPLAGYGYDVDALRRVPPAWELFQWRCAMSIATGFVVLEEALLSFTRSSARHFEGVRSIPVLEAEEEKHIALFRRYIDHLAALHPSQVAHVERSVESLRGALIRFADPSVFPSPMARHYSWWLLIVFFEELTVWLPELLDQQPDIQPAWLAVHRAHRQEELQHVLTDAACLAAIRATDEERYAWSREVFERIAPQLALAMSPEAGLQLAVRTWPEVGQGRRPAAEGSPFARLLETGAFARTCAAGPYFAAMAAGAPKVARASPPDESLVQWIEDWAHKSLGRSIQRSESLIRQGLDSLGAIALCGDLERRLDRRLPLSLVYDHPTAELLSAHLAGLPPARVGPVELAPALLARQVRLLALDAAYPGQILDHITVVWETDADAPSVQRALRALVARHPTLWQRYLRVGDRWEPAPLPSSVPLPWTCIVHVEPESHDERVCREATAQDARPFLLSEDAPWRVTWIEGPTRSSLVWTGHHVALDGWSMEVIARELDELLRAEVGGRAPSLPPPVWVCGPDREQALLSSEEGHARIRWWRERLSGHSATARPAAPVPMSVGAVRAELSPVAWEGVTDLARRLQATPFLVMLTAFHRVLVQRTGEPDQLVATHLFNRRTPEERRAVNYLVNPLPLRTLLDPAGAFERDLALVQASWLDALENDLSVDHLVSQLWPERWACRWMPAPMAFNQLLLAEDAAALGLRPRYDLAPPPAFLFFEAMLVAAPRWAGASLTLWYDLALLGEEEALRLLTAFVAELTPR